METVLSLQSNLYSKVVPTGAYYTVSEDTPSASRTLLCGLFRVEPMEAIDSEEILTRTDASDINTALSLLYRLQRLEFLYGDENVGTGDIRLTNEQLPDVLTPLFSSGRALLADKKELYFADAGSHHEAVEEPGLLTSKVAKVESDHQLLIRSNLRISNSTWDACDLSGQSESTFLPLYIRTIKLTLVMGDIPDLNRKALVTLAKVLYHQYGSR